MKAIIAHCSATLSFFALLAFTYNTEISTTWAYMGFRQISGSPTLIVALAASLIGATGLSFEMTVRNFTISMFHYLFFVPGLIVFATDGANYNYGLSLAFSYVLIYISSLMPTRALRLASMSPTSFSYISLSLMIATTCILILDGGLGKFNLNIYSVYEFRRIAGSEMSSLSNYLFSGTSKVVGPMTLALAIYLRKFWLGLVAAVLTIVLFGMTHHKSVLFLPIAAGALFLFLRHRSAFAIILFGFILIAGFAASEVLYREWAELPPPAPFTALIVRRILFVPALLDFTYIDFFSGKEKIYWATSKLGFGLADNPYDLPAPLLIGANVFYNEGMSANTGIIGSGFSHAGWLGIAVYAALLGLLISYLNTCGRILGHGLVIASSLSLLFSILSSTDLTTAFFTHGLILLIFLLTIFPRKLPSARGNE